MQTVIVRYEGALAQSVEREIPGATTVELFNEYGVVTIPDGQLETLRALPEVEYIELPKRLYFDLEQGRRVSCLSSATLPDQNVEGLQGKGVLVGIIDSGIDYSHPDFIRDDGTSRIAFCWDQSGEQEGRAPEGFSIGVEYTAEDFDKALRMPEESRWEIVAVDDRVLGHGTAVAGVAAGNGRGSVSRRNRGIAAESDLILVKLAGRDDGFPRTTEVMEGLDYVLRKAIRLQQPIAVNLSFGNNYGPHDGRSLFENYISELNGVWKNMIVVAAGNEGNARHHTQVALPKGDFRIYGNGGFDGSRINSDNSTEVEFALAEGERALTIQLWKSYVDRLELYVVSPSGERLRMPEEGTGVRYMLGGGSTLSIVHGTPTPYTISQEIYMEWTAGEGVALPAGIWSIVLYPREIREGVCNLWMSGIEASGSQTGFLMPVTNTTLTIPATADRIVSVGAYQADTMAVAPFSGRGFTASGQVAPTLVAPGVDILTAAPGGGYARRTGTSIAAPFVTGAAALLMEWGIVRGNDVELYGEKGKAYLMRGAKPLPGITDYPDVAAGYGRLCVEQSIPK